MAEEVSKIKVDGVEHNITDESAIHKNTSDNKVLEDWAVLVEGAPDTYITMATGYLEAQGRGGTFQVQSDTHVINGAEGVSIDGGDGPIELTATNDGVTISANGNPLVLIAENDPVTIESYGINLSSQHGVSVNADDGVIALGAADGVDVNGMMRVYDLQVYNAGVFNSLRSTEFVTNKITSTLDYVVLKTKHERFNIMVEASSISLGNVSNSGIQLDVEYGNVLFGAQCVFDGDSGGSADMTLWHRDGDAFAVTFYDQQQGGECIGKADVATVVVLRYDFAQKRFLDNGNLNFEQLYKMLTFGAKIRLTQEEGGFYGAVFADVISYFYNYDYQEVSFTYFDPLKGKLETYTAHGVDNSILLA